MAKVSFVPLGKSREIKPGATILAAANQCGVAIGQSCSGEGICGWCRVTILEGAEHMAPPTDLEQRLPIPGTGDELERIRVEFGGGRCVRK